MFRKKIIFLSLLLVPIHLNSYELMKDYFDYSVEKPLPTIDSDLIYGDGSSEITTNINQNENIVENAPIQGSIFVTHDAKNIVDDNSFLMGDTPLKVTLVQSSKMSSSSPIVVTIYSFELKGMKSGTHTLPPISVKVAGKKVLALPLVIQVSQ